MIKKRPSDNNYTLKDEIDGEETVPARPPKFSFPDRHGEYRRKTKKEVDE
ncbi:MAG: nucleolar RNA-binding Nop10p family protein [Candidatus Nanosalina sp.]